VTRALILGCSGLTLTEVESSFFQDVDPWGFILFSRNIESPHQVRTLTADLRKAVNRPHAPIFIDQEGGRVQRLMPPHWLALPPANTYLGEASFNNLTSATHDVWHACRLLAHDLRDVGITANCMPVLDLSVPGAHPIIGNRAYSSNPEHVTSLGRAAAEGLLAGNVLPVIKHIPGHGRALVDSHDHLPEVQTPLSILESEDFMPFRALADMPLAMTAHVVYTDLDPNEPATTSPRVIQTIRQSIGYNGLLMSDDVAMKALSGPLHTRAKKALEAGCDAVLHCSGILSEMESLLEKDLPQFSPIGQKRADEALSLMNQILEPFQREEIKTYLAEKFFPFFTTSTV
jgi:beta-N-acetylhexosaminidase